jgi:hypothetical protein
MRILLLFALVLTTLMTTAKNSPPNIIIILNDDMGYADIGCFGAKKIKTPRIDQMAREGRQFTSFYVSSTVCSASRAALLTGCYPELKPDGHDIRTLMMGAPTAKTPYEAFYFNGNTGVRSGNWKYRKGRRYGNWSGVSKKLENHGEAVVQPGR